MSTIPIETYEEFASAYPPDAEGVHHVLSGAMSTLSGAIELPPGHALDTLKSSADSCISGVFTGTARAMSARGRGRWS